MMTNAVAMWVVERPMLLVAVRTSPEVWTSPVVYLRSVLLKNPPK
jgi:hypothetical protein